MSHENLRVNHEVIRRWLWGFENDTDALRATLHPEIEWFPLDEDHRRLYGIDAALYPGSFSQWSNHDLPVATRAPGDA